jgi:hypothetical protein
MAKTPFKLRSGNVTPFKMMGSSPAKTTGHGGAKDHKHPRYTEEWDDPTTEVIETEKDITTKTSQKGIGTTTTPGTVGKPVERIVKKGEPGYDEWLAAVTADPSIEDKYKSTPEKIETKPLSKESVDVKTKEKPKEKKWCHCKTYGSTDSFGTGEERSRLSYARYECGTPLPPECVKSRSISESPHVASTQTHERTTPQVKWPYTRPGQENE